MADAPERAAILVYMTAGSEAEAVRVSTLLVEERLAACTNVLGGMTAFFRWRGAAEQSEEWVVLAKTRADLFARLAARVRAVHSYDTPCIVALPLIDGDPAFLDWIATETTE